MQCRQLTKLQLRCTDKLTDYGICEVDKCCVLLKSVIALESCNQITTDKSLLSLAAYCVDIEYLSIALSSKLFTDIGVIAIIDSCVLLYYLNLSYSGDSVSDNILVALSNSSNTKLTELIVYDCKLVTIDGHYEIY